MNIKFCYGCIHQRTPAEWGKCMRKYTDGSSCEGRRYKRRKDFDKWDQANRARSLLRSARELIDKQRKLSAGPLDCIGIKSDSERGKTDG